MQNAHNQQHSTVQYKQALATSTGDQCGAYLCLKRLNKIFTRKTRGARHHLGTEGEGMVHITQDRHKVNWCSKAVQWHFSRLAHEGI